MTTGADTAGVGIGIKRAFDAYGRDITVRSMVASTNYIEYPADIPWSKLALQQEWDRADVVHIHNSLHAHHWYDDAGKPTVLMHHGLGETFSALVEEARELGIVQIGSTIDLSVHEPSIRWSGPAVDIDAMQALRRQHFVWSAGRSIRVGHAPTNAAIKGTAAFAEAMHRLSGRYPVEPVLIQRMTWKQCLALKATCDILFDQPVLGYGVNAIEAWAMGLPVVAGVADPRVRGIMLATWGRLPFVEADETGLEAALERLIADPAYRFEMTAVGAAHVQRWHSQRAVVKRLTAIYRATPPSVPGRGERRLTDHQIRKIEGLPEALRALA